MDDEEIAAAEAAGGAKVLHIPTVFGSVVLAYNLGDVSDLKLDSDTLSAIYLGEITMWNDPRIAALNPDADLPDQAIQAVHRSDSSGHHQHLHQLPERSVERVRRGCRTGQGSAVAVRSGRPGQ